MCVFFSLQPALLFFFICSAILSFSSSTDGDYAKHNMSEDCLYLNVFVSKTATLTSKLNVMLFLYGGSWKYGGSSFFGEFVFMLAFVGSFFVQVRLVECVIVAFEIFNNFINLHAIFIVNSALLFHVLSHP